MANWCSNKVTFIGTQKKLSEVSNLFQQMIDNEKEGSIGQMPGFINKKDGYFFEIDKNTIDDYTFCYDTRWSPNIEILWLIANHYNVEFVLDYEEYGMKLFGKTIYENQFLNDCRLSLNDFKNIVYDEESDHFEFEGKTYEDDSEIIQILLNRKIAIELP
ncbi:DUF1281 family ferredoxin-like fold protein [Chryseobacterium aquaticum]|uniref:YubB ferredoxin-like domain-containing protein n=1 Tax=Chryseobacterium aquaticum subsp. greenlandense TaxID=345663 RepID=A0A101CLD9_9FLAO|nr:hypothetical protein [Chryseobacterium aquaticum]KUJ58342.1 hypothetical protein AR686_00620 [Chryseobacterium aquaticum subsp. greenlandense]